MSPVVLVTLVLVALLAKRLADLCSPTSTWAADTCAPRAEREAQAATRPSVPGAARRDERIVHSSPMIRRESSWIEISSNSSALGGARNLTPT